MPPSTADRHWPVKLVLAAALASATATMPGVAHADSLVYAKAGNVWISHPDGSGPRQVTPAPNNWAWPSEADDGTIAVAGGQSRVNQDGSDADGSSEVYRFDQKGARVGPFVETYGSRSTPACPTDAPTSLRVSPNGQRVSFDQGFCGNRDSFYQDLSNGHQTLISEDYSSAGWLDDGHIVITHVGPEFGNATYAAYDVADPGASHGPTDDPYLPSKTAVASRSGNRVAVYEEDPNLDGSVHSADIRIAATNADDVTDPVLRCTVPIDAGTAVGFTSASPTLSPDGTRLAWAEKDGIHTANTSNLEDCASVTDTLLVAGAAYPFFGKADIRADAGTTCSCPPPPPPPPPPHHTFAVDSATRKAKLSRKGTLTVSVRSAEAGTATVKGSVKAGHRTLRFKARRLSLAAGTATKVTLKLSKGDARRVLGALRAHRRLTARLSVAVTAAGGDTGGRVLSIRLRL